MAFLRGKVDLKPSHRARRCRRSRTPEQAQELFHSADGTESLALGHGLSRWGRRVCRTNNPDQAPISATRKVVCSLWKSTKRFGVEVHHQADVTIGGWGQPGYSASQRHMRWVEGLSGIRETAHHRPCLGLTTALDRGCRLSLRGAIESNRIAPDVPLVPAAFLGYPKFDR
jgi:hypothetical protein